MRSWETLAAGDTKEPTEPAEEPAEEPAAKPDEAVEHSVTTNTKSRFSDARSRRVHIRSRSTGEIESETFRVRRCVLCAGTPLPLMVRRMRLIQRKRSFVLGFWAVDDAVGSSGRWEGGAVASNNLYSSSIRGLAVFRERRVAVACVSFAFGLVAPIRLLTDLASTTTITIPITFVIAEAVCEFSVVLLSIPCYHEPKKLKSESQHGPK